MNRVIGEEDGPFDNFQRSSAIMECRFGWKQLGDEEFQESEMWEMMEEKEVINEPKKAQRSCIGPIGPIFPSAAAMMIPRPMNMGPGPGPGPDLKLQSAPVNVPNWSKIYGKSPMPTSSSYDVDDDGEGGIIEPPHEWLARKERRMKMSSMSVCEGAGRTLKGRDMRRVRHVVLTKTGFI